MKTVEYIKTHGLKSLCDTFHVIDKRHPVYPNLVFLKYSQIDSPMGETITQECRGLILDEAADWKVVSYPFRKFFNHGEGHAAPIDWGSARVLEKLDGSLMTLYWYDGKWQVASNGTPDAGGPVYGHKGTFADLFWETFKSLFYQLPNPLRWAGHSFMFELMTPWNRVVVPHREPKLVCLGGRNCWTLEEIRHDLLCGRFDWHVVRSHPLGSFADCMAAAAALNPMESEGYVVCDGNFNRVKVKSPQYVAIAHLKDGFGPRRMIEIVRTNEGAEFIVHFPEYATVFNDVRSQFCALCDEVEAEYLRLKGIPVQKDFAGEAVKTRCSSALFSLRGGKVATAREFFAKGTVQTLERLLKVEMAEQPAEIT